MSKVKIGILGAGLSGLSLAYFLQKNSKVDKIDIFEKEDVIGGLCRSYKFNDMHYDIGPHIIFSKSGVALEKMKKFLGSNLQQLRRSNKILYKGRLVKYPFENELAALPTNDKKYCLDTFLNNPYDELPAYNMNQFFLKTFGEGISSAFLIPYNKKIWKFDPSYLDTQMVHRIPKPPREDVIRSAKGEETEGYVHQLFFYYPKGNGIASLINNIYSLLNDKVTIKTESNITQISKINNKYKINKFITEYDVLVSTIPLKTLCKSINNALPKNITYISNQLYHNSIKIFALEVKRPTMMDGIFALTVAEPDIIFHRVSNLNFLHNNVKFKNINLLLEVTYRNGDHIDSLSTDKLKTNVIQDLLKLNIVGRVGDVKNFEMKSVDFAYVIYDINHRKNVDAIKEYIEDYYGINLLGRFGEHEYLNMDQIILRAMEKAKKIMEVI